MATRAAFEAAREETLSYFGPVTAFPGFPRALAATLHELRLAGIDERALTGGAPAAADLAHLLTRFEAAFAAAWAEGQAMTLERAIAYALEQG